MRIYARHCLLPVLAALVASCLSLNAQNSAAVRRVTAPIDETHLITLPGNVHPLAQARFDRGPAPSSTPTGRILLVLQRSAAQQQALTQYLDDLQNPSASSYHQWLTPAQYGARFGISDSDLQTVETWLLSHGFKVEKVPQARNIVEFSGTFGQIQSAFHTSIHTLSVHGETHFANMSDPQIPAALAPVVAAVGPLQDFHPRSNLAMGPRGRYDPTTHSIVPTLTLFSGTTPLLFVDPADAATIYDTPNTTLNANDSSGTTYDGSGVNIGIAGDSDVSTADVGNYRIAFMNQSAPSSNIPIVVVDGNDPGFNGDEIEALLDNEVAGGLAPGANLYFYTSANSDLASGLYNAIYRALDDNTVSILSISFGSCEAAQGSGGNLSILESAEQAAAQGISVTVSTGDSGSAGCDNPDTETTAVNGYGVNGIASTPYNIAVGGTDYDVLADFFTSYVKGTTDGSAPYYGTALKYIPEEPWNDSTSINTNVASNTPLEESGQTLIVAGSGGESSIYVKPSFQNSLTSAFVHRDLPDVSLLAGNGLYGALWVVCADNQAEGESATVTHEDCGTTDGAFTNSTTFVGVGGTSASAPAFAGMLALVSQAQGGARLGQADTVLYQLAKSKYSTVFHDVTTGDNSVVCTAGTPDCGSNGFLLGYDAGSAYDLASGLGSVDVTQMISNWSSVHLASTSTTLNINGSTAAYSGTHGQSLTLNVGVNPTAASGVVGILDTANETAGGTASGPQNNGQITIPLTSGAGTTSYNGLPGGSYTVTARYGGDTSDAASTSTPISVTIAPEASTTTLEANAYNPLTGNAITSGPIPYGSMIIADAQITGSAEGTSTQGAATGKITFMNGSTTLGTSVVSSLSQASWPPLSGKPFIPATAGTYNLTAAYTGDASYNQNTSAAVPVIIAKDSTNLTAGPTPVPYSSSFNGAPRIDVTLIAPYNLGAAPTGTVTVTVNGKPAGSITQLTATAVTSGPAPSYSLTGSLNLPPALLVSGSNPVTAAYSGDSNYTASSASTALDDTDGVGSFTLSGSGDIALVAGEASPVGVTVTPSGGFYGNVYITYTLPTGVTFTTPLGNVPILDTLPNGDSTQLFTSFTMAPGTYPIKITGTDVTGKTSASMMFNLVVSAVPSDASFTLSNQGPASFVAGYQAFPDATLTITPVNGFVGPLSFTCSITTSMSNVPNPPGCKGFNYPIYAPNPVAFGVSFATTITTTPGDYTVTYTATDTANTTLAGITSLALTIIAPPPPELTLGNSGDITLAAGATTGNTNNISVTPSNGFLGAVNLTCAVTTSIASPNDLPTCAVISPVTINSTLGKTAKLTLTTTASTTSALNSPPGMFVLRGGATLALVLLIGIPGRRRAWRALLGVVVILLIGGTIGCGGSAGGGGGGGGTHTIPGTTAGAYTITVTGTDAATGTITGSTTLTLNVT
ncbi:MAG TPA: protease pro-enzyme activation domain-containing protein [Acidobacteriaceae bacterium]|jgi:hypothetical protein|nr:protease pro-enzyme activation domain-containing protein [Acidobacteriaceae bacterium]